MRRPQAPGRGVLDPEALETYEILAKSGFMNKFGVVVEDLVPCVLILLSTLCIYLCARRRCSAGKACTSSVSSGAFHTDND